MLVIIKTNNATMRSRKGMGFKARGESLSSPFKKRSQTCWRNNLDLGITFIHLKNKRITMNNTPINWDFMN